MTKWPRKLGLALIWLYQHMLSPWLPSACRFHPSCSEYTRQAVATYGLLHGSWLGLRRLLRCHPFHPGGYDPLPLPSDTPQQKESGHRTG